MATKQYTEQDKSDAVNKAKEIGFHGAAKELGIPWQTIAKWNRESNPSKDAKKTEQKKEKDITNIKATKAANDKSESKKQTESKVAKRSISDKKDTKSKNVKTRSNSNAKITAKKPTTLEKQNAVLIAENKELKAQINKLRKAIAKLI